MKVVSQIASDDQYHYGFNGKYKDNEFAGVGNNVDYGDRRLDTRTGRWPTPDKLEKKYPSFSTYSAMGCNPIYIKDVDGRDLKIGGDLSYSLTDIQSLVPKNYRAFVKVTGDGMIAFQSNKLPEKMQKYKSVVLLNNMINSENHYLYVAGDVMPATEKGTNRPIREFGIVNGVKLDFGTAIDNLSKTPRSDKPDEPLPAAGFDGALRISIGQFSGTSEMVSNFEVPRELVIFHELDENYLRTEEPGMDYGPAHKKAGTDGLQFRKDLNIDNFAPKGDISGGKFTPTPTSSPQSTPSQPTTQPVAPQKR